MSKIIICISFAFFYAPLSSCVFSCSVICDEKISGLLELSLFQCWTKNKTFFAFTAQKMKFSSKNFFSKFVQKKSLMENLIFLCSDFFDLGLTKWRCYKIPSVLSPVFLLYRVFLCRTAIRNFLNCCMKVGCHLIG